MDTVSCNKDKQEKCKICEGAKFYELEQCGIVTPVVCGYCDEDGNWLGIGNSHN